MYHFNKWVNTIYSVASGSRTRRNLLTPFGALFFSAFVLGYLFLALLADSFLGFPKFPDIPYNYIIGIPVFLAGFLLSTVCIVYFAVSKGTPVPLNPPPRLITRGPYSFCRNPMVTGLIAMFSGLGIFWSSVSLTFILTPVFVLLNVMELKNIEEPELLKRFGKEYEQYKKRVPMFIPGIKTK